jgi:hypothetical protein
MRAIVAVLAVLLAGCGLHKSELTETLEWMDNTYNPHEGVSMAFGHGKTGWYVADKATSIGEKLASGSNETFKYDGCKIVLHIETDCNDDDHRGEMCSSTDYRFNLKDIDSKSIKMSTFSHRGGFRCEEYESSVREALRLDCDHAEIAFSTHLEAPLIDEDYHAVFPKLEGASHDLYNKEKGTRSFWEINDVEYAGRFVTAFSHAIELCGGKGSPF